MAYLMSRQSKDRTPEIQLTNFFGLWSYKINLNVHISQHKTIQSQTVTNMQTGIIQFSELTKCMFHNHIGEVVLLLHTNEYPEMGRWNDLTIPFFYLKTYKIIFKWSNLTIEWYTDNKAAYLQ